MVAYVDTSALLKRYVKEPDSSVAVELLDSDPVLASSWITAVELRRNLARLLNGEEPRIVRRIVGLLTDDLAFITFDLRQAEAGRRLGLRVRGA